MLLERDGGYLAINPKFDKLITSLRTAVENDGVLLLLFLCHPLLYDVFAARSPFSRVIVGDTSDDWTFKRLKSSSLGFKYYQSTSNGSRVYYDREPLSRTECKIINPSNNESVFPSPGIASISYSSDGKTLNTTLWLDHPFAAFISK